jgi:hypothetical protein
LCSNLDELDEPEAKASLIWIVGEYAGTIDNAGELLKIFVDTFTEEAYPVSSTHPVSTQLLTKPAGATANLDRCREAILEETRFFTSNCPAGPQHCDQGL